MAIHGMHDLFESEEAECSVSHESVKEMLSKLACGELERETFDGRRQSVTGGGEVLFIYCAARIFRTGTGEVSA
jgi:hypothetical protein